MDTRGQTRAVDGLYDQLSVYSDLLQPGPHLAHKEELDGALTRRWDGAATPYRWLLATQVVSDPE